VKSSKLKTLIKEVIKSQAVYAKGYRQGQSNYYDDNLLNSYEGYPEDWVTGYKEGIKDARRGKFNDTILKILTSIGELGKNISNWTLGGRF
jgi:hypothetical protein